MRVIGLAGWSGAGKTTLILKLIPALQARGLRVSTVKHAHHSFDLDIPGKDSHAHRGAGATEVLIASAKRFALLHELRDAPEPRLAALLPRLSPVDLVLVEGFKQEVHPKLEVHRSANGKPWLHPERPGFVGIVSDTPPPGGSLPWASIDAVADVADMALSLARPLDDVLAGLAAAYT